MKRRVAAFCFAALLLFPQLARAEQRELRLPVVMYHHISEDEKQWNDYVVSIEDFAADLDYLASHGWHSIGVRDLLDWCEGSFEMPEKPFMMTFDDGFESTLAYAEPLLADYGFCGVVAVIGSVCEKFSRCGEHDPEFSNLSWEDASGLAGRGVIEVQCHTWDMHALWPRRGCQQKSGESGAAYRAALTKDLERFLRECRAHDLELVPAIAYPYGASGAATDEIAREKGFRVAFTCEERINALHEGAEGFLRLGRFNRPHGPDSERFFSAWEEDAGGERAFFPGGGPPGDQPVAVRPSVSMPRLSS